MFFGVLSIRDFVVKMIVKIDIKYQREIGYAFISKKYQAQKIENTINSVAKI